MSKFDKGDVVLVCFPHEHNGKRRPAVVTAVEEIGTDFTLMVPLINSRRNSEKLIPIQVNSQEGRAGGVRVDCSIDCSFLAKVPNEYIVGKIGRFPAHVVEQIDKYIE